MKQFDIPVRLRRLRKNASVRAMFDETSLVPAQLVQPVFLTDGPVPEPIESMPGIERLTIPALVEKCKILASLGVYGIAPFPKTPDDKKSPDGAESYNPENLICRAIRAVKAAVPEMVIFADIALDPYTTHGHDGVLTADGGDVDNDPSVEILCKMAVENARAGADFVAPSDMMDGRIAAIRAALDAEGLTGTGICAYSAKFASAYYGPFRDAVGSKTEAKNKISGLSKKSYQANPANRREAIREALFDEAENADMVMVKPAGIYLDIIRDVRENTLVPVVAYQVSGEYSQLVAAAQAGWLDLEACRDESLLAIRRAGADLILTYFAESFARSRCEK
ncbi:MAG: porphobilinogen synthase [Opitutales bacterium]|nr:porphobilinogen synthase [Opitutales bacterium]